MLDAAVAALCGLLLAIIVMLSLGRLNVYEVGPGTQARAAETAVAGLAGLASAEAALSVMCYCRMCKLGARYCLLEWT